MEKKRYEKVSILVSFFGYFTNKIKCGRMNVNDSEV